MDTPSKARRDKVLASPQGLPLRTPRPSLGPGMTPDRSSQASGDVGSPLTGSMTGLAKRMHAQGTLSSSPGVFGGGRTSRLFPSAGAMVEESPFLEEASVSDRIVHAAVEVGSKTPPREELVEGGSKTPPREGTREVLATPRPTRRVTLPSSTVGKLTSKRHTSPVRECLSRDVGSRENEAFTTPPRPGLPPSDDPYAGLGTSPVRPRYGGGYLEGLPESEIGSETPVKRRCVEEGDMSPPGTALRGVYRRERVRSSLFSEGCLGSVDYRDAPSVGGESPARIRRTLHLSEVELDRMVSSDVRDGLGSAPGDRRVSTVRILFPVTVAEEEREDGDKDEEKEVPLSTPVRERGHRLSSVGDPLQAIGVRREVCHFLRRCYFEREGKGTEEEKEEEKEEGGGKRDGDTHLDRHFVEVHAVGSGTFSTVYRVRDREDRVWAVKRGRHEYLGVQDRARQLTEVAALWRVSPGCEYILRMEDAWEEGGVVHIQTEYCARGSLAAWLEAAGAREEVEEGMIWRVGVQVGQALAWVHGAQILHMDVKPANCMIAADWSLRLGDFGHALDCRGVGDAEAEMGEGRRRRRSVGPAVRADREGDREYLALEVLQEGLCSVEADIFSLGITLLEMSENSLLPSYGPLWQELREGEFTSCHFIEQTRSKHLFAGISGMMCPVREERMPLGEFLGLPPAEAATAEVEGRRERYARGEIDAYDGV